MRDELAERLLAQVLEWTPEDIARERPILQALATYKYDEYQQFSPGMRFIESFALWLAQFSGLHHRRIAYDFVRHRLIFVSDQEMNHLISIAFPDYIRPVIIEETGDILGINNIRISSIVRSLEYKKVLRQCLFIGLSDGAHIDIMRRSMMPDVSHEQILQTYQISTEKAKDLLDRLQIDLHKLDPNTTRTPSQFKMVFLIDDFSGSGISYFRTEPNGSGFGGKIHRILQDLSDTVHTLGSLFDMQKLKVYLILYVATQRALDSLTISVQAWRSKNNSPMYFSTICLLPLKDDVRISSERDTDFMNILEKYFDPAIIDSHYEKGKHQYPHLGFDECALPLILHHNCPNNSAPLFWFDIDNKFRGLFPRISRHSRDI